MDKNEVIDFCKKNNFDDIKAYIENLDDLENSEISPDDYKDMEFLFVKSFDAIEVSLYKIKDFTNENSEPILLTMQILMLTSNNETIPFGFNINEEDLNKLTEQQLHDIIGKSIFRVLADYGKYIVFKILKTKDQQPSKDQQLSEDMFQELRLKQQ